jgi:transposase
VACDQKAGADAKKKSTHAAEQDRPDIKEKRDTWFEQFAKVKLQDLVFLDEFGAATNMARTRARGPRGRRVVCSTPHGHWKTVSTVAAMNLTGVLTAVAYDGALNTECFVGFVEQFLIGKLKAGQVLILDNLPAHKSPRIDQLVESVGAKVIRLPPYSPDFNPIEMAISKVKAMLRKLAARSVDTLIDAIGRSLLSITAEDALNYIRHSGYATLT